MATVGIKGLTYRRTVEPADGYWHAQSTEQ